MSGKPPNRPHIPFIFLLVFSLGLGTLSGFGVGCAGQFHRLHTIPSPETMEPSAAPSGAVPAIWVSGCWTWHHDHYVWVPRYGIRHASSDDISTVLRRSPTPPGFV